MLTIRASSLSELFECPFKWYTKNIEHKRLPCSGAAQLGTAIHAGAAAYDQGRIDGAGYTIDDTAAAVVDRIWHPEEEVVWDDDQKTAEKIGLALHKKYCERIAPQFEYVGVEVTCNSIELADLDIRLTGSTDRVYQNEEGQYGIADLKTGGRVVGVDGTVNVAGHATQLGLYEILVGQSLDVSVDAPAMIIGLQTAKTDTSQRVGVGEIVGAKERLLGTEEEEGVLSMASKILKSGLFYGNPRSPLCSEKYCPAYPTCRWK